MDISLHPKKKRRGKKTSPVHLCHLWKVGVSTPKTPPFWTLQCISHHGVFFSTVLKRKPLFLKGFFGFLGHVLFLGKTTVFFWQIHLLLKKTLKVKEWKTAALYPDLYEPAVGWLQKIHQEIFLPTMWCVHRWFSLSWGLGGSQDQKKITFN